MDNNYKLAIEQLDTQIKCTTNVTSIKTCKLAIEALDKQIPKKIIHLNECSNYGYYCPNCSKRLFRDKIENKHKCCYNCGQKIDYSECIEY